MSQNTYSANKSPTKDEKSEQDGRLTTRHIQTLSFLQEVAKENKELKARIDQLEGKLSQCSELHVLGNEAKQRMKRLQEDFNRRLDRSMKALTQKHQDEIMQLVSNKLEAETQWLQEREQLEALMRAQEEKNAVLTDQLDKLKKHDLKLDVLNQQLDKTIAQVMELKTANEHLITESSRLTEENMALKKNSDRLQDYESHREQLRLELAEAQQKIKELSFKITQLERDLTAAEESKTERSSGEAKLKKQIQRLNRDASEYQKVIAEQQEMEKCLREDFDERTRQLEGELSDKEKMLAFIERLQDELRKKEQLLLHEAERGPVDKPEGVNFRDFVHLKREVNQLREENDELRTAERLKPLALPSLKAASPGGDSTFKEKSRGKKHSATSSKSSILSISNMR